MSNPLKHMPPSPALKALNGLRLAFPASHIKEKARTLHSTTVRYYQPSVEGIPSGAGHAPGSYSY